MEKPENRAVHKTQLNNAEYSGLLLVVLLFMHSQGAEAPTACFLLVVGSIVQMWGPILTSHWVFQIVGSAVRYAGMFMLIPVLQQFTTKDVGQFSEANINRYETVTAESL